MLSKKFLYFLRIFFLHRATIDSRLKYNLYFTLSMIFMMYIGDLFLTVIGRTYIVIDVFILPIVFTATFLFSFCNKYIKILVATALIIPIAMNLNCITYFGTPMGPEEIYRSFSCLDDVGDSFLYVWFIEPFIIVPYVIVIYLSIYFDKKYYRSTASTLLLFYGFFWIYKLALTKNVLYATPVPSRTTVINSLRTFPWTILHFNKKNDDDYPKEVLKKYKIEPISSKLPRIIFLIWGESTNTDYLSIYGKSRFIGSLNDMPKLDKIISNEKEKFTLMKSLSCGCETEGSTTLFFNLLHEPTNFNSFAKGNKQNLFTLAKANGYKTHWLSVSNTNVMTVGGMPADHVVTKQTHILLPQSERDDYLLNQVKSLDLSEGKHFVVIQFHSLHEKYDDNYADHKDEFEFFKKNKSDDRRLSSRKRYINNVFYLDYLLSETINFAKKNDADYIFYTADHGETIGTDFTGLKDGIEFGHGRLGFGDMIVPFLLYQKEPDVNLQKELEAKKIITHYEISSLIAKILGYNVVRPNMERDIFFMYGSVPFDKNIKLKKVKRINGEFKELYSGNMLDYLIKTYDFKPKKNS